MDLSIYTINPKRNCYYIVRGLTVYLKVIAPYKKNACINQNVLLKARTHSTLHPAYISMVPIKCAVTCPEVLV